MTLTHITVVVDQLGDLSYARRVVALVRGDDIEAARDAAAHVLASESRGLPWSAARDSTCVLDVLVVPWSADLPALDDPALERALTTTEVAAWLRKSPS